MDLTDLSQDGIDWLPPHLQACLREVRSAKSPATAEHLLGSLHSGDKNLLASLGVIYSNHTGLTETGITLVDQL